MATEARSERLQVTVTPTERAAIEKAAKREGTGVSDYLRTRILFAMVMEVEPEAFRALGRGLGLLATDLRHKFKAFKAKAA